MAITSSSWSCSSWPSSVQMGCSSSSTCQHACVCVCVCVCVCACVCVCVCAEEEGGWHGTVAREGGTRRVTRGRTQGGQSWWRGREQAPRPQPPLLATLVTSRHTTARYLRHHMQRHATPHRHGMPYHATLPPTPHATPTARHGTHHMKAANWMMRQMRVGTMRPVCRAHSTARAVA